MEAGRAASPATRSSPKNSNNYYNNCYTNYCNDHKHITTNNNSNNNYATTTTNNNNNNSNTNNYNTYHTHVRGDLSEKQRKTEESRRKENMRKHTKNHCIIMVEGQNRPNTTIDIGDFTSVTSSTRTLSPGAGRAASPATRTRTATGTSTSNRDMFRQ